MSSASPKQRVMIVDDEPSNQRIFMETLEDMSENKVYVSGEEALADVDHFLPDLVLLDIMMPGLDGYEICKRMKANPNLQNTKIILVSGKAMIEERLKGYEFGADDYITKPFVSEELLAKAKVFLRLTKFEKEMNQLNSYLDKKIKEKTQELYETQAMLMNAAKMAALGEMAGGVAHEINNPLASISLVSQQIKNLVSKDASKWQDKILEMSEIVSDSVHHIASIVHGLRTFSRDASKDAFSSTPLKSVVKNTLNLCQAKLASSKVKLEVGELSDEVHIYCRPVQIAQVLLNLIANAFDAVESLPEKWVKISFQDKKDHIEISVIDSGKGVPEELREKIFQPLFTTKEVGKGTGLGLSISKGIIKAHSGTLTLNTESPYTEFTLLLPKFAAQTTQDTGKTRTESV